MIVVIGERKKITSPKILAMLSLIKSAKRFSGHYSPRISKTIAQALFFTGEKCIRYFFTCCFLVPALSELVCAQAGEWTWMKGSSSSNSMGSYGTIGVPDPSNDPPALYEAYEWTDTQGNFWLFGGYDGTYSFRSALWKFDPSSNEWTWVKGSSGINAPTVYGTQGVPSPSNDPGGRFSGATWVDAAGNLFLFGGYSGVGISSDLWKYDLSTNEWTWMKGPNSNMAPGVYGTQGIEASANYPGYRCEVNSAWTDNNGNLWLFGGGDNGSMSLNDLWRYNPSTNNWTWMKGSNFQNSSGTYGTMGVADPSNTPGARMVFTRWKDADGNFWLYSGRNSNFDVFNDLWKYDVATNEWTWISGTSGFNSPGNYGTLCVADSGYISSNRTENRAVWTDACGNFWFFGGANSGYGNYFSDLWLYNTFTDQWVLVSGSNVANQNGTYGTQGVADPANIPPGIWGSSSWTDLSGNLWLFGGSALWGYFKNALWKYEPDPNCAGCSIQNSQSAFVSSDTDVCEKFCIDFFDSSLNNPTSWLWLFEGGSPSSSTQKNPANICYQDPGIFDVTLITTNANGISDTLTLSNFITVYSNPFAPVISQNGNTLTSTPATSYQWQLNGVDIPGATDQSYTITQSGLYTVLIGDVNGCSAQASTKAYLVGIPGIEENLFVNVFPNPSDGNFMIELNGLPSLWGTENILLQVTNALGQEIFLSGEPQSIGTSADKTWEVDLSNPAPGVYFLVIKSQNIFLKKKIVITN